MNKKIEEAVEKLQKYIERNEYRGWDPYDGLSSPLFKLPFLKTNKLLRFGFQQFVKRSPLNLRPLLGIKKGLNPVTLGLCLQGYAYQLIDKEIPDQVRNDINNKLEKLIVGLDNLKAEGYAGASWGYDFDWEARYAKIPAYQPTVVATGIITNGLYECYKITGNQKAKELLVSSSRFILNDLNRSYEGKNFCFSYSPFDKQVVYNASMKGARLLAQVYKITGEKKLFEESEKAVSFVIDKQNEDGSWFYSDKGDWVDNYHTGYILDCLNEYIKFTGDNKYHNEHNKGFEYYKNNFFSENGKPWFYNNNPYPVDLTAGGQSILTLTRFGEIEMAERTAEFLIDKMQDEEGYFYFRNYKNRLNKTSFMRWSDAWMFSALNYLKRYAKR